MPVVAEGDGEECLQPMYSRVKTDCDAERRPNWRRATHSIRTSRDRCLSTTVLDPREPVVLVGFVGYEAG